ncbi:methylated-DNA--[protein]-cysteine S-methyltransferase [Microbacterium suaedae]|uniref:methylated-DNA--[protein]-cysteine S-methyltransferase n=1 Tax=Microbacterium suaedae TaxID=2067813 RepID=UPI000DA1CA6F|nr:methylated-DNA--[protein]-cysteine S-methyltransferase [Microbacterium suaedae]
MRRHLVTGPTPVGALTLFADDDALAGVYMTDHRHQPDVATFGPASDDDPFLLDVALQLAEYFDGDRTTFDIAIAAPGTPFQQSVWDALREIPYGETWSYRRLAEHLGRPGASRAVGLANGRNPVSIVVPCHRVIGADGSLTGYGGGVERKRWLLAHERAAEPAALF